jgi:glutaconate CoA-transferase subunit B
MGLLQRGRVDAGFIGGAQIDRFGNINTSYIGDIETPKVKLPGSGGAPDIAAMSKRLVAIMNHQKHRFVDRVDYVTSPGNLDGAGDREKLGLEGGPAAVISDRCILRPWGKNGELHLASLHPRCTLDEVREHTAWPLATLPDWSETPAPTPDELDALHAIDKDGFWRRDNSQ